MCQNIAEAELWLEDYDSARGGRKAPNSSEKKSDEKKPEDEEKPTSPTGEVNRSWILAMTFPMILLA